MRTHATSARRVFVDTSAQFALINARDSDHPAARALANRLVQERWRLFTTNFIVAETHALVLTRLNRMLAARYLQEIDRSPTTIIRVSAPDERRARAIVFQYDERNAELTVASRRP